MISPTVEQVLDFEGNVERAVAAILTRLGFAAYPSDHDGLMPVPRVEVIANMTEAGPHEAPLVSGEFSGDLVYDQQNLRVTIKYYFAPEHAKEYAEAVGKFRGAFRRLIFYSSKLVDEIDAQQLYRAAHASVRERGGIREVETEENCWSMESSLDLVIFIALDRPVNAAVVSGGGESDANGYYALSGKKNGKPRYRSAGHEIAWISSEWRIKPIGSSTVLYSSGDDTDYPWQADWDVGTGDGPAPGVSQASIRDLIGHAPPPEWY